MHLSAHEGVKATLSRCEAAEIWIFFAIAVKEVVRAFHGKPLECVILSLCQPEACSRAAKCHEYRFRTFIITRKYGDFIHVLQQL